MCFVFVSYGLSILIYFLTGIFVGPQIRKIFKDRQFYDKLNPIEQGTFEAMGLVIDEFLGNKRSKTYKENVDNLLIGLDNMGANMSLKIHFLDSHLDFFAENCGAISDEHGERFHQEIMYIEERFNGKSEVALLAEYVYNQHRDLPNADYARQASYNR